MRYLLLACIVFWLSCTTQRVGVDYDRGFDFTTLNTYSIQEFQLKLEDIDKQRIKGEIIKELARKNMVFSDKGQVVVRVSAVEYLEETEPTTTAAVGFGGGFGGGGFGSVGIAMPLGGGTIQRKQDFNVGMHDALTGELRWQGALNITMPKKPTTEMRLKAIQKGVTKLFASYPPSLDD